MIHIFDSDVKNLLNLLDGMPSKRFAFDKSKVLPTQTRCDLVLLRDCAFELGGSDCDCIGSTVVTDDIEFESETVLVGKELKDVKRDCNYAKIVLLSLKSSPEEEQQIFDLVKSLEYAKYDDNVKGFMMRASAFTQREQVRVSKQAVKNGLNFEKIGATTIASYLKKDVVKAVKVIFVADADVDFAPLYAFAEHTKEVLDAFNHLLDNVLVDCAHCNLKSICDQVEGMRELHVKMAK